MSHPSPSHITDALFSDGRGWLKHTFATFLYGIRLLHHPSYIQLTTAVVAAIMIFWLLFNFGLTSLDKNFHAFFHPQALQRITAIDASIFISKMMDTIGDRHFIQKVALLMPPLSPETLSDLLTSPALWIGVFMLYLILTTYEGVMFRRGAGWVEDRAAHVQQTFRKLFWGTMFLTGRWVIRWAIVAYLLYRNIEGDWPGLATLILMLPFFFIGMTKLDLNQLVFKCSLDLKASGGFTSIRKIWHAFSLGDFFRGTTFNLLIAITVSNRIILVIISFGLVILAYLIGHFISLSLACIFISVGTVWAGVVLDGTLNFCSGKIYAQLFGFDFIDHSIPHAPFPTRGKKVQRWKQDDVAPAIILHQGNMQRAPSRIEQLAARKRPNGGTPAALDRPPQKVPSSKILPLRGVAAPKEIELKLEVSPASQKTPTKAAAVPKPKFKW